LLNNLTLPTDEELIKLSNGDLIKCITLTLDRLNKASTHGENTSAKAQIYQAYEDERLKRQKLVQQRLTQYFL
jgi:hypothetical protein